jgi:hypothetical protein
MTKKILVASFNHDARTGELKNAEVFEYKTKRGAENKRDKLCTNNEQMRTIEMLDFGLTQRRDKSPDKTEDRSAVTIDVKQFVEGIRCMTTRVVQHVAAEIIEEEAAYRKAQQNKSEETEVAKRIRTILTQGQTSAIVSEASQKDKDNV